MLTPTLNPFYKEVNDFLIENYKPFINFKNITTINLNLSNGSSVRTAIEIRFINNQEMIIRPEQGKYTDKQLREIAEKIRDLANF